MKEQPRLCFVGPMVGINPGYVTTQGEILAEKFASLGYPVISVSTQVNRYKRLIDILSTILRKRHKIDVLCLQVFGGPSFVIEDLASGFSRTLNHRIVMVLHGGSMPEFMTRYPHWVRRVLQRADVIVVPSTFLARTLAQHGFQVRIIPNVIDLSHYTYRHRSQLQPKLFWMRTFHPIYNPEMAVHVLARLRRSFPYATLVMAGQEKGSQENVKRLAEDLNVTDAVRFSGFLDPESKAREAEAADIFLNTNHVDNMPVSLIEACAMGLPVVATDVGGISDLLQDGHTCLLVPDNDDESMTAAVQRLLSEPELAGQLSARGKRLAESFDWPRVYPRWESLFQNLVT